MRDFHILVEDLRLKLLLRDIIVEILNLECLLIGGFGECPFRAVLRRFLVIFADDRMDDVPFDGFYLQSGLVGSHEVADSRMIRILLLILRDEPIFLLVIDDVPESFDILIVLEGIEHGLHGIHDRHPLPFLGFEGLEELLERESSVRIRHRDGSGLFVDLLDPADRHISDSPLSFETEDHSGLHPVFGALRILMIQIAQEIAQCRYIAGMLVFQDRSFLYSGIEVFGLKDFTMIGIQGEMREDVHHIALLNPMPLHGIAIIHSAVMREVLDDEIPVVIDALDEQIELLLDSFLVHDPVQDGILSEIREVQSPLAFLKFLLDPLKNLLLSSLTILWSCGSSIGGRFISEPAHIMEQPLKPIVFEDLLQIRRIRRELPGRDHEIVFLHIRDEFPLPCIRKSGIFLLEMIEDNVVGLILADDSEIDKLLEGQRRDEDLQKTLLLPRVG